MDTTSNILEIEVNQKNNRCLQFFPIERRIRGKLDLNRVAEPRAKMLTNQYPEPIPGQRLRLDLSTGAASLVEPLREDEYQVTRERLEKKGNRIAPRVEEFEEADTATWLYWMVRAVKAGYAKVVSGKLPELDSIKGKPQKNFFLADEPSKTDRVADAMEKMASAIESQTQVLTALVKQQKAN